MPGEQPPRPGLQDAVREGLRWQHEKVTDLVNTFGVGAVLAKARTTRAGVQYAPINLDAELTNAAVAVGTSEPTVWLVEPEFPIGHAFDTALGIASHRTRLGISYADLRPDLVEVRPPTGAAELEVAPGGETVPLAPSDVRLRLRVIDIKLTAEPSRATSPRSPCTRWLWPDGCGIGVATGSSS
jgi:DNA replication ATP-dependent helicase Dna2